MRWQDFLTEQFELILRELETALEGLSIDDLNRQPTTGANSIGWLAWHLTRSHDRNLSEIMGVEQLWTAGGWHERFGRAPNHSETGVGHSPEEAAAFRAPDTGTILDYHRAVLECSREYVRDSLSETELDRVYHSPTLHDTTAVSVRLRRLVKEGFMHTGQAAYVRGLLEGHAAAS